MQSQNLKNLNVSAAALDLTYGEKKQDEDENKSMGDWMEEMRFHQFNPVRYAPKYIEFQLSAGDFRDCGLPSILSAVTYCEG
jgi:hypothetical protein